MSTYLWTYTPPQWTRLTHCTWWCLIIWISTLFIQDLVCGGEPVSRNPRQNTNTITGTVPRPNKHVRQKPWPNIDPTEEQPILCDYFFWKWKLSAWREYKTKRREDSSLFQVLMIETVSENEKTKVWNKKIFLFERWTYLRTDFHIHIGNICHKTYWFNYTDLLY